MTSVLVLALLLLGSLILNLLLLCRGGIRVCDSCPCNQMNNLPEKLSARKKRRYPQKRPYRAPLLLTDSESGSSTDSTLEVHWPSDPVLESRAFLSKVGERRPSGDSISSAHALKPPPLKSPSSPGLYMQSRKLQLPDITQTEQETVPSTFPCQELSNTNTKEEEESGGILWRMKILFSLFAEESRSDKKGFAVLVAITLCGKLYNQKMDWIFSSSVTVHSGCLFSSPHARVLCVSILSREIVSESLGSVVFGWILVFAGCSVLSLMVGCLLFCGFYIKSPNGPKGTWYKWIKEVVCQMNRLCLLPNHNFKKLQMNCKLNLHFGVAHFATNLIQTANESIVFLCISKRFWEDILRFSCSQNPWRRGIFVLLHAFLPTEESRLTSLAAFLNRNLLTQRLNTLPPISAFAVPRAESATVPLFSSLGIMNKRKIVYLEWTFREIQISLFSFGSEKVTLWLWSFIVGSTEFSVHGSTAPKLEQILCFCLCPALGSTCSVVGTNEMPCEQGGRTRKWQWKLPMPATYTMETAGMALLSHGLSKYETWKPAEDNSECGRCAYFFGRNLVWRWKVVVRVTSCESCSKKKEKGFLVSEN